MAKGDKKRMQNVVDEEANRSQQNAANLRTGTIEPQLRQRQGLYDESVARGMGDYDAIMAQYRNFQTPEITPFTPVSADTVNPTSINPALTKAFQTQYGRSPELESSLGGYGEFAKTGGFDENAIRDIRARGISPIRSVYANAMANIDRNRALQGGYSPNYVAATQKMSRTLGDQVGEHTQNINAQLAQMIQQGRLSGLSGLQSGALSEAQIKQAVAEANAAREMQSSEANATRTMQASEANAGRGMQAQLANQDARLRAAGMNIEGMSDYDKRRLATAQLSLEPIRGQASLYGTSPGMAGMFGNQVTQSTQDLFGAYDRENQASQNRITGQNMVGQMPSNFETGLGRTLGIGKVAASVLAPWMMGPAAAAGGIGGRNVPNLFMGF